METQLLPKAIAITFVVAILIIWAWKALNQLWLKPRKKERILRAQGFVGNPYRFLVGDLKELDTVSREAISKPIKLSDDFARRLLPYDVQHIEKYGKESFIWYGPIPRIHIMDPERLKTVFNNIGDFERLKVNPLLRLIASGLANYDGEKWAKHRRIIRPAFHLEKLKLIFPAFHMSCNEMLTKWDKSVPVGESREIDVWPHLKDLTLETISRAAFGSSFEEGKKVLLLQASQLALAIKIVRTPMYSIPGWRLLPTETNRRMKSVNKELESVIQGIINKRVKAMKAGEATKDDFLRVLVDYNMKETEEPNKGEKDVVMTLEDVISECKFFYFAGRDTTSVLLVWTMVSLCMHPEWQARAREEVLRVFGSNEPDFDGLTHLKIVNMILYEVLRLYPPVPQLSRTVVRETKLGDLTIPAGVEISLPVVLIHHDKELWGDDAKEFNPERFASGVSKATRNLVIFVPFIWGPRMCIGQNFALTQAKLAIAMMLQRYSFEFSPSYAHAPLNILSMHPQFGAQFILHRR